ncbi:hypothetical protein F4780DRAFT_666333 [Xylariomycetidae sp. FL0641]|nr:hypothetical protein F4780DRAFT_666333 [Xylariomycetidae sp. FL0641]
MPMLFPPWQPCSPERSVQIQIPIRASVISDSLHRVVCPLLLRRFGDLPCRVQTVVVVLVVVGGRATKHMAKLESILGELPRGLANWWVRSQAISLSGFVGYVRVRRISPLRMPPSGHVAEIGRFHVLLIMTYLLRRLLWHAFVNLRKRYTMK